MNWPDSTFLKVPLQVARSAPGDNRPVEADRPEASYAPGTASTRERWPVVAE